MISLALGKLIDKLPAWGQFIIYSLAVVGGVYYIARYGLLHFLLRVIFSP